MRVTDGRIVLDEDDWREIFSIFTSCAEYERTQVYDPGSSHYFKKVQLYEEY